MIFFPLEITPGERGVKNNKRQMDHKAQQRSSSKLPSPAFWTGLMIHAC